MSGLKSSDHAVVVDVVVVDVVVVSDVIAVADIETDLSGFLLIQVLYASPRK